MSQSWTYLPLGSGRYSQSFLLVKWTFTATSYGVWLTDLTRIWTETAASPDILRRSVSSGTSIDASESPAQLEILLAKLQDALKGECGTSLELQNERTSKSSLVLKVESPLPSPLKPLQWCFSLELDSQQKFTSEFVWDLIVRNSGQHHQIESLTRSIRDKDYVIAKMADKLDALGMDMSTIFPAAASLKVGKRGPKREEAAKLVKGLGDFNENRWKEETAKKFLGEEASKAVFETAFVSDDIFNSSPFPKYHPIDNDWWLHLTPKHDNPYKTQGSKGDENPITTKPMVEADETSTNSSNDGDFQRQETPPGLKGSEPPTQKEHRSSDRPSPEQDQDQTTDDEVAQRKHQTQEISAEAHTSIGGVKSPIQKSKKPRKLGMIGGKKIQDSQSRQSADVVPNVVEDRPSKDLSFLEQKEHSRHGRRKHRVSEESQESSANESQSRPRSPSPKPNRRLGMIKGKSRVDISPSTPLVRDNSQNAVAAVDSVQDTDSGKQMASSEREMKGKKQASLRSTNISPEEDTADRADRKREELKKQLQEKGTAPAKKKRRF